METGQILQRRDRSGEYIGEKPCRGKALAEEGQVRRVGDKPCGDGTDLAEEGHVRRINDKPCEGKRSCRGGQGQVKK